jgi:putative oxidoreductase
MVSLGLLVLRLAAGAVLVAHGAHKLFGAFAGPGIGPGGLTNTAAYFTSLGLEPGFPLAVLAGIVQFAGGLLLITGFLARWAAIAVLGYMAIGIWKEHAKWGFFLNWIGDSGRANGMEYSILFAGVLFCLAVTGAGDWSIDGRREVRAASRAAGRARLRHKI